MFKKFLILLIVFSVGLGLGREYLTKTKVQDVQKVEKNTAQVFISEIYDKIKENYWNNISDAELLDLFNLSMDKSGGNTAVIKFENKDKFLELTPKGKKRANGLVLDNIKIVRPQKWDQKWRVVIYDIANDKKDKREILRQKLEHLGFLKLQESVYVFPFDCLQEINLLKRMYYLGQNVQYLIVERIETEIDLLSRFYDRGILTKKMV